MAVYYGKKTLAKIDERYAAKSKTRGVVNKGFTLDFADNGTVTIQTVETVAEVDYIPSGRDRFGSLVELGNGVQDFVLRQDKAYTFSIDRKSSDSTVGSLDVKKAIARQIREVSIPNTDKYILATIEAYAVSNTQTTTNSGTALTTTNSYQYFLQLGEYLTDQLIENENIVVFMTRKKLNLLNRNSEFKIASEAAYKDNKNGADRMIDGMSIVVVPSSYLPANTGYLALADSVVAAPMKTNMTRTLTEVQGVDGVVAEGRRRYDALIASNRGKAIVVHMEA